MSSARLAELAKRTTGNDSGRLWICDRSRGVNGHEAVNGVPVTYYTLGAKGVKVVKVGAAFYGELTPIASEPANGFDSMTELEAAYRAGIVTK